MGCPTPFRTIVVNLLALFVSSLSLLGHYRENPDEATRPPQILQHPKFTEIPIGMDGALYVYAIGAGTLDYQWFHNNQPVDGSNSNILKIEEAQMQDGGFYMVEISSEFGTARSDTVRLRVDREDRLRIVERHVTGDQANVSTIEFYDGYFYAARPSREGDLWRSAKGYVWEAVESSPGEIMDLVGGDDRLLAVMPNGEIAWTEDFENWESVLVDPESRDTVRIVHSLGIFAAMVNTISSTRLLTSADGSNWQLQHEFAEGPGSNFLVATNGFITACRSTVSATEIASSINGSEWNIAENESITDLRNALSFDESALLVSRDESFISTDGVLWESFGDLDTSVEEFDKTLELNGEYFGLRKQFRNVRWVGGRWSIELYRSSNLRNWTHLGFTTISLLKDDRLTFEKGNGVLLYGPIGGTIYPVEDFEKIHWLDRTVRTLRSDEFQEYKGIEYLFDRFAITRYDSTPFVGGTHRVTLSREGKTRLETSLNRSEGWQSLAFGNGVFTTGLTVGTEVDTMRNSVVQVSFEPKRLLYGNGVFVGISGEDIWYSSDGDIWEMVSDGFLGNRLFFAGDRFFSQGDAGSLTVSTNGSVWTEYAALDSETSEPLVFQDIGYFNGRYIGIDNRVPVFRVYESDDALSWDKIDVDLDPLELALETNENPEEGSRIPLNYIDMAFSDDGLYFMFSGLFAKTSDFVSWRTIQYATNGLFEVAYGNGSLIAVSADGRIVQWGKTSSVPPLAIFRNRNMISTTPHNKVDMLVDAFDVDGEIEKVEFYVDGEKVREVHQPPFDWEWTAPKTGIFDLGVVAEDDTGLKAIDGVTARVAQNIAVNQFDRTRPQSVVDISTLHNSAFALGEGGLIYRSDDLFNWQLAFAPSFDAPLSLDSTSSLLYAPTTTGVYVCHDGKNWVHLTDESSRSFLRKGEWFQTISQDLYNWNSMKVSPEVDVLFTKLVGYVQSGLFFRLTGYTFQDAYVVNVWGTATPINLPLDAAPEYASSFDGYNYVWTLGAIGSSLYQSTSLENWSFINTPVVGNVNRFEKVGDLFVLEGSSINQPLPLNYISSDGFLSWKETGDFGPIVHRNGLYVGILDLNLVYSEDGDNWTQSTNSINLGIEGEIADTKEGFLALDSEGGMFASIDGIQWTPVNSPGFGNNVVDIAYNGSKFVALSGTAFYTSIEGAEWESHVKPNSMLSSIASRDGLFVANGENGTVFVSIDGQFWVEHQVDDEVVAVHAVEYLPEVDRFILETHTEQVWTSGNGIDWISNPGLGGGQFRLLGERLFVYHDGVYSTNNGIDFEEVPHLANNDHIQHVNGVYLSTVFVNPEIGPQILRSLDGIEWEIIDLPDSGGDLYALDTGFVFINSDNARSSFSENGLDWDPVSFALPTGDSIVAGGKRWYLDWAPLGNNDNPETSVYMTTQADLSIENVRLVSKDPQVGNPLLIRVSIRNQGPNAFSFSTTKIHARLSDGTNWVGTKGLIVGVEELPNVILGSQEVLKFDLLLELPELVPEEHTSIQLMLNPDRSPPEVDLSNNYAWLRLLPAPEIELEDQHDETVKVSWTREGGYVKRIEYSHDFENWFLLDAPEESTESGIYTESIDPNRETFYRARAE